MVSSPFSLVSHVRGTFQRCVEVQYVVQKKHIFVHEVAEQKKLPIVKMD
jgi:hypothetical protein